MATISWRDVKALREVRDENIKVLLINPESRSVAESILSLNSKIEFAKTYLWMNGEYEHDES